jgi:hypothetical protein
VAVQQTPVDLLLSAVEKFGVLAERWHSHPAPDVEGDALPRLHVLNFRLWHHEDQARRRDLADAAVVRHKREIDRLNVHRNVAIEQLDEAIVDALDPMGGDLHSETPGSIVDRLSVLSLRIFHVGPHYQALPILLAQRDDLTRSLALLMADCASGRRCFRVYRQFKVDGGLYCALFEGGSDVARRT